MIVSDRYQNYFHPRWEDASAGNQACLSHLLRDLRLRESRRAPSGRCRRSGRCAASSMCWHAAREQGLDAVPQASGNRWSTSSGTPSWPGWPACPACPARRGNEAEARRELLEFCRDRRSDLLLFTEDASVWPTNNISERGVRPLKTQQKISGRLASNSVAQDRLDIRSYIDTARRARQEVVGHPARPHARQALAAPGTALSP